jgi:hypothetical protein
MDRQFTTPISELGHNLLHLAIFFLPSHQTKNPRDKLVSEEEEQNRKLKKAKPQRLEMDNHELKTAKKKPVRSAGQHRGAGERLTCREIKRSWKTISTQKDTSGG